MTEASQGSTAGRRSDTKLVPGRPDATVTGHVGGRYPFVDLWRGTAIIGVVLYHFGWDLSFFGYAAPGMMLSDPALLFARSLAGSFMFLSGVGLVLAHGAGVAWSKFFRRLAKVAGAAFAISVITWFLFPDRFVYFGILHSIAAASVLGLAFVFAPVWVVALACLATFASALTTETPSFDVRTLAWIGFAANPALSNDYVPVFPWFGVTLAGIASMRIFLWLNGSAASTSATTQRAPRWLAWTGRHTLSIYLIHQPALFAGFVAFAWLTGRSLP